MQEYKVAIIGGGIVGACLFSDLTRKGVSCVLLEAASDVSNGSTKANSGIVHAGYDPEPNTLKARFNIRGNQLYPAMCARLKVDILQCGTLVVTDEENRNGLNELYERGLENGVQGLRIIEREELHTMEPNLAEHISCGLFAPTGAVISPYLTCIALCEEGVINGGEVKLNFMVDKIEKNEEKYQIFAGKDSVLAEYVVNCAGVGANTINALVGAPEVPMKYVKGEYLLLDKSQNGFVNRPIFPLPTKMGKGILALPTLHGNIMLGPTAIPCEPHDTATTEAGIATIKEKVELSVKTPNYKKVIKLFAGVRVISGDDFVIEKMEDSHFFYTAGICSPGLTAAPAISEYLVEKLQEDGLEFEPHEFVQRKPYVCTEKMNKKELKELIKNNPTYGKIVCRCEKISEGEILEALASPLKPTDVDAIKRRVRPTMGRCQGGFCLPKVLKIIATYHGITLDDVQLNGENSQILIKE
ncbi:MAG: NAD(P)/FAD-dependent oxidoreductase [Clostridia bacterium]|nr:NAD(P)/FAD-dependent oxidoreductase [Clostridia bacterium]